MRKNAQARKELQGVGDFLAARRDAAECHPDDFRYRRRIAAVRGVVRNRKGRQEQVADGLNLAAANSEVISHETERQGCTYFGFGIWHWRSDCKAARVRRRRG